jgi:acetyltransferase-like isoleucine patch superfamily enzyme
MSFAKIAVRETWNALATAATLAYAWTIYVLEGMEGVNRLVRMVSKRRVVPILRAFGAQIGSDCDIEAAIVLHNTLDRYRNLSVGDRCHIGKEVFLDLADRIIIESQVTISMRATILTHVDAGASPLGDSALPARRSPVRLCSGAYVGAGSTLLPGVGIGACAVVGAGAVVTKPVEPGTVVVGVPARMTSSVGVSRPGAREA